MKKYPDLHEADEPVPFANEPVLGVHVGPQADMQVQLQGPGTSFSIMVCDGCRRWQRMESPFFAVARRQSQEVGWRFIDGQDFCPICLGN